MKLSKEELDIEIRDIVSKACKTNRCINCPFYFQNNRTRGECVIGALWHILDNPNYINLIVPLDFWERNDIM